MNLYFSFILFLQRKAPGTLQEFSDTLEEWPHPPEYRIPKCGRILPHNMYCVEHTGKKGIKKHNHDNYSIYLTYFIFNTFNLMVKSDMHVISSFLLAIYKSH